VDARIHLYACGRQVFVNMYLHAMRLHELGMQYRTGRKCTLCICFMGCRIMRLHVLILIPMILGILIESTDQLPFCRAKRLWSQNILC